MHDGQGDVEIRRPGELHEAYAPLLAQLGEPYLGIQSPKAIKEYGQDLGLHPVGTGPFGFVSYVAGQNLVLKRNDDYKWNPEATKFSGPPDIAQITFQIVSSPQARVSQFQASQSDVIQDVPGVFWNALTKMNRFTPRSRCRSPAMGIFAPINASLWPTDDVRVRQAILYGVDRKGVEQLADAGAYPVSSTPLVKGMVGYDEALESAYPFDPARAEALLKEAGWTKPGEFWEKDGKRLAIKLTAISTSTSYPPLAQAVQGYLRKIGIDASVEQMATSRLARRQHQGRVLDGAMPVHRRRSGRAAALVHPRSVFQLEPLHRPGADQTAARRPTGTRPGQTAADLRPSAEDHHGSSDRAADAPEYRPGDDDQEADRTDLFRRRLRVFRRRIDGEMSMTANPLLSRFELSSPARHRRA